MAADEVEDGLEEVVVQLLGVVGGEGKDVGGFCIVPAGDPDGDGCGCIAVLDGFANIEIALELDEAGGGVFEVGVDLGEDFRKDVREFLACADMDDDGCAVLYIAVPTGERGADSLDIGNCGLDLRGAGLGEVEDAFVGEEGALKGSVFFQCGGECDELVGSLGGAVRVGVEDGIGGEIAEVHGRSGRLWFDDGKVVIRDGDGDGSKVHFDFADRHGGEGFLADLVEALCRGGCDEIHLTGGRPPYEDHGDDAEGEDDEGRDSHQEIGESLLRVWRIETKKNPASGQRARFQSYWLVPGSVSALHEEGALADTVAEVVEFRTADLAFVGHLDLGDTWCVKREYAFDTFAVGDFTNGEGGVDAAAALCDDEACEELDTLFATFDNAAMDLDGVAYVWLDDVFVKLLLFDFFDDVHGGDVAERC